jgi:hypothetical protein
VNLTGNPKMDRLNAAMERVMAEKAAARSLVGAVEPPLPFDPFDDGTTQGAGLSPTIRDEWIDTA